MPNDMMIAALNKQRAVKMDIPAPTETSAGQEPQGIEDRLSDLESKYDELCKFVGMDAKTPKETPRGY